MRPVHPLPSAGAGGSPGPADAAEIESIWSGMPRWVLAAYAVLGIWAAAALPFMLTLGGWLEWSGLAEPWGGRARAGAAAAVAIAMGGLMARTAFWRNLQRERRLVVRLATTLLGLPLVAGLMWLCTWQTAEHLGALAVASTGEHRLEAGRVRRLEHEGAQRGCRQHVAVDWAGSGPSEQCISRTEAAALAAGMAVRRSAWSNGLGRARSTAIQPPPGRSTAEELAHTRQALNPLVVFLLLPASIGWAIWMWTLGKHRFIYLGIILSAWAAYLALPS